MCSCTPLFHVISAYFDLSLTRWRFFASFAIQALLQPLCMFRLCRLAYGNILEADCCFAFTSCISNILQQQKITISCVSACVSLSLPKVMLLLIALPQMLIIIIYEYHVILCIFAKDLLWPLAASFELRFLRTLFL